MSQHHDRRPREEGLAFFGAITASVTHELNNVMAVINELAGLLDDILYGAQEGHPVENDKLRTLQDKLSRQVARGEQIIKRLNRFAHTTDEAVLDYDLTGVLDNLANLCRRFAVLRKVRLDDHFPEESISVVGNPFKLQHAVFLCVKFALDLSPGDSVIDLRAEKCDSEIKIGIAGSDFDSSGFDELDFSFLNTLMSELSGKCELVPDRNDKRSIMLTIPRSVPNKSGYPES